jgi:2-polyprenyl-3-methyl-5-hydroxy-6-metoxy-1,4-benzoquinol methylase
VIGKEKVDLKTEDYLETADIETSSDDYARRFAGAVGAWMLACQAQITLDFLEQSGARSVLDVGGGHGQLTQPLVDRGYEVTVLGSDECCAARIKPLIDGGRVAFKKGDVIGLPYDDGAFDAVISFRLLPHCERWERLIDEMARVARVAVIGDYPTSQSLNAIAPLFFGAKKKLEGNTRTWRAFRHGEIGGALRRNGYALAGRRGQFFWPMVVHRMLGRPGVSKVLESVPHWVGLQRVLGSPVIFYADRSA